mmetsp:Transcript_2255/g.3746  ORF Transcript_2255/g.3746 Transcript_2255/m.3746 type:complete len:247 (+) Transcript_2255:41-781(+)
MASQRQQEAQQFIESILGKEFEKDFGDELKSGVVLCEFINKLKPGSVKKINKQKMPFMQMENIEAYINASKAAGVKDNYSFMTVDLFEKKNLDQVALNIVTLKRETGHGFDKQAAPSTPTKLSDLASDQSSQNDVALPAAPIALKSEDVSRTGQAQLAGHKALNATTGVAKCNVCTKPISGACINALQRDWHPKCFTCKKCDKQLSEKKYYEHGNKPYCDRCILIVNPQSNIKAKTSDKGAKLFAK